MFGPATSFSPAQIRVHIRLSKSIKVLRRKKKKKKCVFPDSNLGRNVV